MRDIVILIVALWLLVGVLPVILTDAAHSMRGRF